MIDAKFEPVIIDAKGKPCPMPLLMLKKTLKQSDETQFLLQSSDPHSLQDVTRYCELNHLKCITKQLSNHEFHYIISR